MGLPRLPNVNFFLCVQYTNMTPSVPLHLALPDILMTDSRNFITMKSLPDKSNKKDIQVPFKALKRRKRYAKILNSPVHDPLVSACWNF
jgi:hypothetical protein